MAGTLFSDAVIQFFVNTKQAENTLDAFSRKFDQGISRMRNMVLGFIGVKGLYGYYQTLEKVVDTADRWSMPVEKVSKFTNLFAQFGGTAEEAADSIEKLQSLANNLKFHSSGAFRELSAILGVNLQNKDFQGAIDALRKGMQGLNADAKAEVISMLGVNSTMARMLMAEEETYSKLRKNSEEFGVITENTADKIRNMRQSIAEIKQAFLEIAVPIMDVLKPILAIVRDITMWLAKQPDWIKQATVATVMFLPIVRRLVSTVMALGGAWTTFTGAIKVGVIAAFVDEVNGIYHGIKKAIDGAESLQDVLNEMANHSYVLNFAIKLGGKIGERLFDLSDKISTNSAAGKLMFSPNLSGDIQSRSHILNQAQEWLDKNQGSKNYDTVLQNYRIARSQLSADIYENGKKYGYNTNQDWVGKSTPINDNKTINFNIYGVQGAEDMLEQMRSLVQNNIPPITYKMD